MSGWVEAVIVIAAVAIVLQTIILSVTFLTLKKSADEITRIITTTQAKIDPILVRSSRILEDSEARISSILGDAAEISQLSRSQVQKIDRVFTDAVERLRLQVIRADQILTGTLEVIEDAGTKVKRSVWEPVHRVSALVKGVKAGLDFLKNQNSAPARDGAQQDEELFI